MSLIVFASTGGRKYHFDKGCKAFEYGQQLHDWDTPEDAYLSSWADPKQYPLARMSSTKAAMDGKLPCLACVPAHLREMPETEGFGHEPMDVITNGRRRAVECFRCLIAWPCTSAIVLGLVAREASTPTVIVCYSRCWRCMLDHCYEPPEPHPWWSSEDVEHAEATGQAAPEGNCACPCAKPEVAA